MLSRPASPGGFLFGFAGPRGVVEFVLEPARGREREESLASKLRQDYCGANLGQIRFNRTAALVR
jgi:hypothetical protein